MAINRAKIQHIIQRGVPLTIKTYTHTNKIERQMEEILEVVLQTIGQQELQDLLLYCLRELIVNAKKANTKRVYFDEIKLDIHNEEEYDQGIVQFKQATLDNIEHYLIKQREAGLYIKVIFHFIEDKLHIYIVNNAIMAEKEQMRVYDRIALSRAFHSMEEAIAAVLDHSEGAGLGIVMMMIMLKKIGLDEEAFSIEVESGETIAQLTVPMSKIQADHIKHVSQKLIDGIDNIPQFPESVISLQAELSDPEIKITDIARKVATDPALTADLLKHANSAAIMPAKHVKNIAEAIKLIGLKTLRNMLYFYGTRQSFDTMSDETKNLWSHSYRTAFYGHAIAKGIIRKPAIQDDIYVGGMLHDIGKIVLSSAHPQLISQINRIAREKNISASLFEDFVAGLNHSEIGARITEKWHFPAVLSEIIRFHHNPHNASTENSLLVSTVYLANSLANIEDGTLTYDQIDLQIANLFNIQSIVNIQKIHERLKQKFDEVQKP